jgi:osmotically-inducible protein OsmY
MKTDAQLKTDVTTELTWEPTLSANDIQVTAKDGIVTRS